ncbi:MAG: ATP-binding protein [Acidobacteria bacterium]|nr:ATP-binding protein [Acidobacteriota bacterium]
MPFTDLEGLNEYADYSGGADEGPDAIVPPVPETVEHTGIPQQLIEQLILKDLYYKGEIVGRDLASDLGLRFSVIEGMMDGLKRNNLLGVKSSLGMGAISSRFLLTENGRELAKEYISACAYSGRVPVPLYQYADLVRQQKQGDGWLTMDALRDAYRHMVVTEELLNAIGPAVNSGKSFLIYGQPGNGKTFLAEALFNVDETHIYVPHAIECQGMIIQMFDPVYHHPVDEETDQPSAFTTESTYDKRWFKTRRPFIVSGGELDLKMLDLSYNQVAKYYDAPLQLKANNGIYLIDDFGRQKVTPAEVLNRWIVPMERRVDFLTFVNGSKMTVPFECFLIFSTNLKPHQLGDEAFLRRIQYKMLMKSPAENEFVDIFVRFAESKGLTCPRALANGFIDRHYRTTGKARRRCHPRDVLSHAVDIIRFERLPMELNDEILDKAFHSNFVSEDED